MQLFYQPEITGDTCSLTEEESWHAIRVMRLRVGDQVRLTDGKGFFYDGRLISADHKHCEVTITGRELIHPRNFRLHIAIAPTKNTDRFEWFLEKATEIGIDEITPLICHHSERDVVKIPRLEKVIVAAMKQSLKPRLPLLHQPAGFNQFVAGCNVEGRWIAWCGTGQEAALQRCVKPGTSAAILIGPEGDFSGEEVTFALQHGFSAVSLGPSRLRTETAGVVACHIVNLVNEHYSREAK